MAFIKPPPDIFEFSGNENMTLTLSNTAVSDQTRTPDQKIVRITDTSHGYAAGSLIYISGMAAALDDYNGLHSIDAVATNTFDMLLGRFESYVAGTPAGTEQGRPVITYNEPWEFLGFELHLAAAGGTSEDFTIDIDANKGAAWDTNLYTKDMNGVQDIVVNYAQPRELKANDLLVCAYTNTDGSNLWGLKLLARRIA